MIPQAKKPNQQMKVKIEPKKIIDFFGGRTATQKRLKKSRVPVSIKTIEKWKERGNMPSQRIAQLAVCALQDGKKFDIYDFLSDGATRLLTKTAQKQTKKEAAQPPTKTTKNNKK